MTVQTVKVHPDVRLIYASSEKDANLLYATRFFAPDPFIFISCRGESFLVMSDLEIDRAKKQACVEHVLSLSAIATEIRTTKKGAVDTLDILKFLLTKKKIRTIQVPEDFPLSLADGLRKCGFCIRATEGAFFPEREIKTAGEIRAIRKVQRGAEAGMQVAVEMIRKAQVLDSGELFLEGEKLTSERVKQQIAIASLRHGCVAAHTIVSCGKDTCDPHQEGHGALHANKPIIVDIFPRSQQSGYWGDLTRTLVKGQISERLARMFQAVLKGQVMALKAIKEGARGDVIHRSILDQFATMGFNSGKRNGRMVGFFHGTGHGVGLEIHEHPRITLNDENPLRAGQVVTVEPGLYYPGIGGVRIEDLVLVTKTGYQSLTRFPKYLGV